MTWTATVLTLYPEMFPGPLGYSLAGRALADGVWRIDTVNIRGFATDRHHTVDDTPCGGGAGMVMRPDVVAAAIRSTDASQGPLVYMTPRGKVLDQAMVRDLAQGPGVRVLCGRFEGIDQRVLEAEGVREISLGDFILSGGEPAALVMLDAVARLLPGVMGNDESLAEESFERGLLEYPQFTRPQIWEGRPVPDVLLSGHHEKIRAWRLAQAEDITRSRRPDLWSSYVKAKKEEGSKE
jgi:tRNA (guanine37-N1)-methyltransferase